MLAYLDVPKLVLGMCLAMPILVLGNGLWDLVVYTAGNGGQAVLISWQPHQLPIFPTIIYRWGPALPQY